VNGAAAPNMSKGVSTWHIKSPESTSTPSRMPTIQVLRLISMSEKITLQRSFKQIHEAIALFWARTNVPVREAGREALTDFVRDIF
jgi:hypothetical protein